MSKEKPPVEKPVALIAGPTASGKSDLAVRLALALRDAGRTAVIINADSAQVYADLRVLSARPTEVEMQDVPHHLFGAWDGSTPCSAVDWAKAARGEIDDAHANDTIPILVGGTGLYIRTLLEGIAPVPDIDPEIRTSVRAMSREDAYTALKSEDPDRASKLTGTDSQRIARALEVVRSTGHPLGEWQKRKTGGIGSRVQLHPLILLPDRTTLYERCDRRFRTMIAEGATEEVEALLARDLPPELPVMRAIGVPEIVGWLNGDWSRDEALERACRATRNYAKRQYTWFARQPPKTWSKAHSPTLEREFATLLRV
ncbi:tRNA (adenosine(37)-N6)-dimethylallyltransferase MiaA [Aurantiacibacter spongiae]|uniref:tRNA dimethylallyltransferase n=1 Tax=Aurantiacibacter spongiae TaxID=2488860 RepID=A0A3N5D799_9SPHN|nr:tRNA (adenosine(37)-N6)-dimethylallyltransferase MiaA [Aurantiacibacter spongiae]RPF70398.1 tRNA (adenosine(37)-N6)-dimethylallyltransferase MiaA [Aurantiacibacter spongiae]